MTSTQIDAIILREIFVSYSKAEKNITLSFWEAIKQYDITPFDCLIAFFGNIAQYPAALYPAPSHSSSLMGRQPGKAVGNDFIVWRAQASSLLSIQ